jgi:hypothetical protein
MYNLQIDINWAFNNRKESPKVRYSCPIHLPDGLADLTHHHKAEYIKQSTLLA